MKLISTLSKTITIAVMLCSGGAVDAEANVATSAIEGRTQYYVDITSARQYLDMAGKAIKGDLPTKSDWDSLFVSPAYKALLDNTHWNKKKFKRNVREAFDIVYNPEKESVRDSISASFSALDNYEDELPFFVSTALNVRNKLDDYTSILDNLDIGDVVVKADEMALSLLPNNGDGIKPQTTPIYFIVWDLECRALNGGLFLDVNTFFSEGMQAATEALAHEMHHFYLFPVFEMKYEKDIMDGAVIALVNNMKEGIADILNKKEMPLKSLAPYGESVLAIYNEDYESSPKVLEELDKITCAYLDGDIDEEKYFSGAMQCAHFEGHTTGDFMAFLIRDRLGLEAVVESVGDLDAFVDNYNKAAEMAGTYRFSDKFVNHIHKISQNAKREGV